MKTGFLTFLLLVSVYYSSIAQPYYFRHYQVEQGLSYNSVFGIMQDSKGFMWFASKNGLNRFDGYNFKIFRNIPGDNNSIGSNITQSTYEDQNHILWVATSKGLYYYNDTTEVFRCVPATKNIHIHNLYGNSQGDLVYMANSKLYKLDIKTKLPSLYSNHQDFDIKSITFAPDGTLWVSTRDGYIKRYNRKEDTFTAFDVFAHSTPVISKHIDQIYFTQSNSILIGTSHQGVKLFDVATATYKDVLTYNKDKTGIFAKNFIHYEGDVYWIATESGIFVYNIKTHVSANLRKDPNNPYALSDNAVYTMAKDKEGGLWVGTYFGGVNYYPKPFTLFDKFINSENGKGMKGNAVREICSDQYGNLWVATEDAGLNKLDPKTGKFSNFSPDGSNTSISHTNLHGLLAIGNELWLGTYEQGLDVMDIRTGKVIRHYNKGDGPGSLKSNFIDVIYQTRSGAILIGTSYGLYTFNPKGNNFDLVKALPADNYYISIAEDNHGSIWAGSVGRGLYCYNTKTGKKTVFNNEINNKSSISDNFINSLFISDDHTLWVATENGLNRFDDANNKFIRYGIEHGLPSNVIYRIEEDSNKNLWISTSKGLCCFNIKTGKIKVYTKANGLLSDQFNYNSSFKDKNGKIYFGSVNGMIGFNPAAFVKNTVVPPVYITGFQVFNEELTIGAKHSPLKKSITYTDQLELPFNQSTFSIDFAALVYTDYETAEYAYKMEGVDKNYTNIKGNRKVFYTKLAPGEYTFLVKAANNSGVWNETPRKLVIKILPPFWLSLWAYLIYFITVATAVYYILNYLSRKARLKNLRSLEVLENQKERELYEAKIEFFTQITHEIRTPLTLIKGPIEAVISKYAPEPKVLEYLTTMERNTDRLLELTNQLLDFRKIESSDYVLKLTRNDVCALLTENYLRFKTAAEAKEFKYELSLPDDTFYSYLDTEALNKILSNLLSNAIKYAKSTVLVSLIAPADHQPCFTIFVENDGFLIPEEMQEKIFQSFVRLEQTSAEIGTGIGLALARSLTLLHKGMLQLLPQQMGLNRFCLRLPLVLQGRDVTPIAADKTLVPVFAEESTARSNSQNPTILLVDDNEDILSFTSNELKEDYICLIANNGREALGILQQHAVHAIVSDVMMPVMDGFELSHAIKTNIDYSHIPIILLTAKANAPSKVHGLEVGADVYLEKPFSPRHLKAQISSLLSNRNKLKDHFARSPLVHLKSIAHSKSDEELLENLNAYIIKNISNNDLDVDQLAANFNMSRATFYRKIKLISNLSPNELINLTRLKHAAGLMLTTDHKIQYIAAITGFTSQVQFGRSFTKQFGMKPTAYVRNCKAKPVSE